jgi:hypothetical protein
MKSITLEIKPRPHAPIKRADYDEGVEIAVSDENGADCLYVPVHVYERVVAQLQEKLRGHVSALYDVDDVLKKLSGLEPLPRPSFSDD